ncbi:ubiquitin-like domain-containing protein [Candidatus Leptofilum sp.]|uniref:ubiquitin-like domain-containing protein n=1 Tax=Candidatus Leptofilum sp. TaxID=3241576 RepID=UPI003B59D9CF
MEIHNGRPPISFFMMGAFLTGGKRLLVGLVILLALGGVIAAGYAATQETYTIYIDDQPPQTVTGRHATVSEVLAAVGLEIRPEDLVLPSLEETAVSQTAIQIIRAQPITVRSEAGTQTYWTRQPTLGAFLAEFGLLPQRTDQLIADDQPVSFAMLDQTPLPQTLEIGRFVTVTILDGANQQTLRTAVQTVGEALAEAGIDVYGSDGVEPPLGAWLQPNMSIQVRRSFPLTISVDGRITQIRSHHSNVLDVLAEAGIGLVGFDYTVPGPDTPLKANDTIQVIRVTEDFRLVDEPIPYQTLWQASDQLDLDTTAVVSVGQPGILRQRVRVRYENGVEVSQTVDGEWVAQQPVNQVIGYGTKITIRTVNTPQGPLEYWRVVRMRVTSYTAASSGKPPDHPQYGITASGLPAGTGIVAIDRSVVPFRSEVYVPGYGVGFAGDTGGGVRGRWIDLGYDEDEYVAWSGYVDVYYLTPVPPPEDINYLLPTALP